jgi:hypothetical protein
MRRFVPIELHGFLDYMTLPLFLGGGKIFRIKDAPASVVPAQIFGFALCATCPLTDYGEHKPLGGVRLIPMKQHLVLDAIGGIAIGLAPWLSGSWRKGWNYWAPQAFGFVGEIFFALATKTE